MRKVSILIVSALLGISFYIGYLCGGNKVGLSSSEDKDWVVDWNNVFTTDDWNNVFTTDDLRLSSVVFCEILEFKCPDVDGQVKAVWLDPNDTQIDEGARWFFEEYLKLMCDSYIEAHCKK